MDKRLERKVVWKNGSTYEWITLGTLVAMAQADPPTKIVCHKSAIFDGYLTMEPQ